MHAECCKPGWFIPRPGYLSSEETEVTQAWRQICQKVLTRLTVVQNTGVPFPQKVSASGIATEKKNTTNGR